METLHKHSVRLVPPREGMRIVGVKSPTSYYKLIDTKELPPLIKRGRNSFHLESDLFEYVLRLAAQHRQPIEPDSKLDKKLVAE